MNIIANLDQTINQFFTHYFLTTQNTWSIPIMLFITSFLNFATIIFLGGLLCLWFLQKKQHSHILLVIAALGGGALLDYIFKLIIARPRPLNGLVSAVLPLDKFSFPSGHATLATIFFLLVIYGFHKHFKQTWLRWTFSFVNILLIAFIGFSRLYIGVHWFSDVIAGFILGGLWFYILISIFHHKNKKTYFRCVI